MFRLFKNLKKRELMCIFIAFLFIIAQVWLELKLPDYMSEITRLVQTEGSEMSDIIKAGAKMLACAGGSLVSSILVCVLSSKVGNNFATTVREKLFRKVQDFSMEEINHFSTASLITRSTNDVQQVQMLIVMGLQVIVKAPVMAVWAILKIYNKSWQWTTATAVAVVVLLTVVGIIVTRAMPKFKIMQSLTDDINRVTRENITGLNVVHAYNGEKYQEEKFEKANDNLTSTHLFTSRTMAFMMPSIQFIMNGLSLSIYCIGAYLINASIMSEKISLFSDMVVFSSYAIQVVMSFMMLVMIFMILPRASVAAKRIMEVLDKNIRIVDGTKTESNPDNKGEVEFKNVSFRYPDASADVIENISFTAKKGQTVAFIGSTGCGKSTVINLIPRFYDVTGGEVLVDGINVKEYQQKELRNKIGYVSQKAILFSGDITSNVAYGNNSENISDDDVKNAVAVAQSTDFIENQKNQYHGYVAQGGSNFSGGQKQRISIARAIAKNPEILIFDDSFSALDYKTDRKLRSALKEKCKDITKLIVAQRIGTIRDADQIIVLDGGKIAGKGTHDELIQSCEVYQQIALSQLSKEEMA
ncbi:MAG: ABC transporter ATP-binding protein/permease [Ruminococcus sp.]|nr:ABC transporter ATP-binding protein/permease [Ruminococcus sp.]MDE7098572.1 ABC transporter ATP-binding protein/permease [Ruminococcus sp.]